MPAISVLIKPASSACNLNCRYCFYRDVAANRETAFFGMSDDKTTETLIKKALAFSEGDCSFMFQGGEPTLRGLSYFKSFVGLEKKYAKPGQRVFNSLQTNGLLIDDDWAQFLASNGFLTGLSLDGNAEIHNLNRVFPDGSGSFGKVMNAAHTLERHGAQYNVLSVVTGQSARKIEKIYNFFKKNGLRYLQFIPCLEPLSAQRGEAPFALTPAAYGEFLIRLFDLWSADLLSGNRISIRYFDNLMRMLNGLPPEECAMRGCCGIQFVIEGDGSVYPCDFFVLDGFALGNIRTDDFADMLASQNAKRFIGDSLKIPEECKCCRWYGLCRNGCKRDRVSENGSAALNYYCPSYKMFFEKRINGLLKTAMLFRSPNR